MPDFIRIRGAKQNNLKGIDLDIPKRTLTVITGLSGSGKSSLVFDTIFAEGQRRYMESLSTYAKQFLERLERPDYETMEGISPTIAIEQKNPVKTARSTVGTTTEIYDYMRLLYARVGDTFCPGCSRIVQPDTVSKVSDEVLALGDGTRILVTFPVRISSELTWDTLSESLISQGFVRIVVDGRILRVDTDEKIKLGKRKSILVVVDRITVSPRIRTRLVDSLETAMSEGEGEMVIRVITEMRVGGGDAGQTGDTGEGLPVDMLVSRGWSRGRGFFEKGYTEKYRCPDCGMEFTKPTPLLFSFNNPFGACPACRGFGNRLVYDRDLIVPNPQLTLEEGAIDPWTKPIYEWWWDDLLEECESEGIPTDVPFSELRREDQEKILYGDGSIDGVIPFLEGRERKKYKKHVRFFLRRYQSLRDCSECGGGRLRRDALNVRIAGKTIVDVNRMTIDEARLFFGGIDFTSQKRKVSRLILREVRSRLDFLHNVGVGYLTLDRLTRTLSGGEAQRINLASALGNQLIDAVYILDEPTIGLHPRDTGRLIRIMTKLRDQGNTLLVVEHDRDMMESADHIIELGPEAGEHGGEVIYQGGIEDLKVSDTPTGRYLAGKESIEQKKRRKRHPGYSIRMQGVKLHNLKDIDVEFPLGLLVLVTGVSGAGKSTLIHDVLYRTLEEVIAYGIEKKRDYCKSIEGVENISRVVLVDQSPIGKTPRSNPVSYVQALGPIREVFAKTALSRRRRYKPGRFSFNVKGGRCEECKGEGFQKIEMHFMADVYVRCEECGGSRFRKETLEVTHKGKNIAEVLSMTVDEAIRFFEGEAEVARRLWYLSAVGLGYLRLGQSATTLSGGEAQRVKIARELSRVPQRAKDMRAKISYEKCHIPVLIEETNPLPRGTLYIMDEPTTGLHYQDIRKLLTVLGRLVDSGNTVLVIEHNIEVVKSADWIIDLGPEGGDQGGRVVAVGTPEQISRARGSHTGRWLAKALREDRKVEKAAAARGRVS
ncbi:MAG: excinuclease ABC subunit UvrA [Candidatus Glassbacteria bacterium]